VVDAAAGGGYQHRYEYQGDCCRDDPHCLLMIVCEQGKPAQLREALSGSVSLPGI
jgi:hypothetical protein